MRILLLHNSYGRPSGEEVVIASLGKMLRQHGHEVLHCERSSAELEKMRCGRVRAFFSGIWNPLARRDFAAFLRGAQPDVVHVHNVYPLLSPSVLGVCTAQGVPLVMTVHNFRLSCPNGLLLSHGENCHRCLGGKEWWCVLRNCERSLAKSLGYAIRTLVARRMRSFYTHVDQFVCLTEFQRQLLVREGLPESRSSVIPNPTATSSRLGYGTASSGSYVAYVGRISPEKDVGTLLAAAARLPGIPFRLAGGYDRMPELVSQAPRNVCFVGHLDKAGLEEFYGNARLLVFATKCYEGFPTVLLEAMGYRLPIICSCIGGLPEIVDGGRTGLLYEPGNVAELTARIQELWGDPARCQELGRQGRRKLEQEYAPERLLERILEVYCAATERKSRRRPGVLGEA